MNVDIEYDYDQDSISIVSLQILKFIDTSSHTHNHHFTLITVTTNRRIWITQGPSTGPSSPNLHGTSRRMRRRLHLWRRCRNHDPDPLEDLFRFRIRGSSATVFMSFISNHKVIPIMCKTRTSLLQQQLPSQNHTPRQLQSTKHAKNNIIHLLSISLITLILSSYYVLSENSITSNSHWKAIHHLPIFAVPSPFLHPYTSILLLPPPPPKLPPSIDDRYHP